MTSKTIRMNMMDSLVRFRTRDTLLTCPTEAELAAAGISNYNPQALGKVWDGVSQALESLDALPKNVRDVLGQKIMAYGAQQEGWKLDATGAYVTNDGRKMSDGAIQASQMRDLTSSINAANKKFWADAEASRNRR
jgi:hypothetical protein